MRQLLLCTIFLLGVHCLDAQTTVSGGIYANTTFSPSGSPYTVTGDLTVYEGATLTLDPGTELKVDSGKTIFIRGNIVARGTAAAPVYVHGHTTGHSLNFWKGFVFGASGATGTHADFNYCNISNAAICLNLDLAYGGPYYFRNSTFTYNASINHDGGLGGTFFDSCTFANNYYGLTHFRFGGKIANCIFDKNAFGAEGIDTVINCRFTNHTQTAMQTSGYTAGCELYSNIIGVECSFFNGPGHTFINNKVKGNTTGIRIMAYAGGSVNFTGNEICSNSLYNVDLRDITNCDLSQNCWCLTDSGAINAKILDGRQSAGKGLVGYIPFISGCLPYLSIGGPGKAPLPLQISPNPLPARASLHIGLPDGGAGKNTVSVRDVNGRSIYFDAAADGNNGLRLQFSSLAPGFYSVIVASESGQRVTRFLAQE